MNFENKKRLAAFDTVSAAIVAYYKRDRIGEPREQVARVEDTERWMGEEGHAILASRHESVTGRPLWIRPEREGFVVYEG